MTETLLIKRINGIQPIKEIMIDQKSLNYCFYLKNFFYLKFTVSFNLLSR